MPGDLAYKSPLLIEIHALEIRLVVGEDLVGLGNDPNLESPVSPCSFANNADKRASELSSSMAGRGRYWTGFRLNNTWSPVS